MKKILILSILLIGIYSTSFSQVNASLDYVKIDYDAAGNRIKRSVIIQEDPEIFATSDDTKLDKLKENSLKIYPNPVSDNLSIELLLEENKTVEVTLIDINGKLIKKFSISNGVNNFNLNDLAPGEYFLTALIESKKRSWKLTKL
jgi:hypothetical protein